MPKTKPPEFEDRPAIAESDPNDHLPPGTMKCVAKILCFLFGVYVFSYVALSSSGAYAPFGGRPSKYWAPNNAPWTQDYEWAPAGFYTALPSTWPPMPRFIYALLWAADLRFWHTSEALSEMAVLIIQNGLIPTVDDAYPARLQAAWTEHPARLLF